MIRTRRKPKRRQRRREAVPNASATAYTGPIIRSLATTQGISVNLRQVVTVTTTAGGVASTTVNNNPSSGDNWADYVAAWSEYRVLGIQFEYVPFYKVNYFNGALNITDAPMVFSTLHSPSTPAPASISQAWGYGSSKLSSLMTHVKNNWHMSSTEEAGFISTAAPASTDTALLLYANGSALITYGQLFITYLVQFRSRTY